MEWSGREAAADRDWNADEGRVPGAQKGDTFGPTALNDAERPGPHPGTLGGRKDRQADDTGLKE